MKKIFIILIIFNILNINISISNLNNTLPIDYSYNKVNAANFSSAAKLANKLGALMDIYSLTSWLFEQDTSYIYFSNESMPIVINKLQLLTYTYHLDYMYPNEKIYILNPEKVYQDENGVNLYTAAYGIANNNVFTKYGQFVISEYNNKIGVLDIMNLGNSNKSIAVQSTMCIAIASYLQFSSDWNLLWQNNPNTKLYSPYTYQYYQIKCFNDNNHYMHILFQVTNK